MKQCNRCKSLKEESEFPKRKDRACGIYGVCKDCKKIASSEWGKSHKRIRDLRAYSKKFYRDHPDYFKNYRESHKESAKEKLLNRLYGITVEEYNVMFELQHGRCAICGIHQSEVSQPMHIDHDHNTGRVRGLLCLKCNPLLGFANDDIELLKMAILYLEKIA